MNVDSQNLILIILDSPTIWIVKIESRSRSNTIGLDLLILFNNNSKVDRQGTSNSKFKLWNSQMVLEVSRYLD